MKPTSIVFAVLVAIGATASSLPVSAAPADSVPASGRLSFDVIRNGKDIGDYVVSFRGSGNDLDVSLSTDVMVKLPVIGVSAYRFKQQSTETWRGGKLAGLLNEARSAVTVNSTAAQQVLWRGIPLKIFGTAVYAKPEFVSDQSLTDFFADPRRPDTEAYRLFRRYLLETSQVPGGFYSARGRRALLRHVVDMVLAPHDPYDALRLGTAAPRQQLRVVR